MCTMILYLAITLPAWTSDWSETARQVHTWLSARCTHNCQPGTHMAVSQVHTWLSARYTHDCQPSTCITASRVCVITLSEWRHEQRPGRRRHDCVTVRTFCFRYQRVCVITVSEWRHVQRPGERLHVRLRWRLRGNKMWMSVSKR